MSLSGFEDKQSDIFVGMNCGADLNDGSDIAAEKVTPSFSIVPYLPILLALLQFVVFAVVIAIVLNNISTMGDDDGGNPNNDSPINPIVAVLICIAPSLLGFLIGAFIIIRSSKYRAGARVFAVIGTALCGTVAFFPVVDALFPHYW
jgi:hypothetical protein